MLALAKTPTTARTPRRRTIRYLNDPAISLSDNSERRCTHIEGQILFGVQHDEDFATRQHADAESGASHVAKVKSTPHGQASLLFRRDNSIHSHLLHRLLGQP